MQLQALQPAGQNGPPPAGDGIGDSDQANVCSLIGIAAGKWLTLAARSGLTFGNVQPGGPPDFSSLPEGYAFPLGFMGFTLTGLPPALLRPSPTSSTTRWN